MRPKRSGGGELEEESRIRVLEGERRGEREEERVERESGMRLHLSKSMYAEEHAIEIVVSECV